MASGASFPHLPALGQSLVGVSMPWSLENYICFSFSIGFLLWGNENEFEWDEPALHTLGSEAWCRWCWCLAASGYYLGWFLNSDSKQNPRIPLTSQWVSSLPSSSPLHPLPFRLLRSQGFSVLSFASVRRCVAGVSDCCYLGDFWVVLWFNLVASSIYRRKGEKDEWSHCPHLPPPDSFYSLLSAAKISIKRLVVEPLVRERLVRRVLPWWSFAHVSS